MWKQFAAIGAVGGAAVAASQYINDSTATPYHERYSRDTQSGNILKAIGNTPRKPTALRVQRRSRWCRSLLRSINAGSLTILRSLYSSFSFSLLPVIVIELESLSKATGRRILAKAEYMNPGDECCCGLCWHAILFGYCVPFFCYPIISRSNQQHHQPPGLWQA